MSCGRYVVATAARRHLEHLASIGVGARQIELVAGVGHTEQWHIKTGRRKRIHPQTQHALLGVCGLDRAPGSRIPAGPTWELIECLLRASVRQWEIAEALGYRRSSGRRPQLQLARTTVSTANAAAVKAFHDGVFLVDARVRATCSHVR